MLDHEMLILDHLAVVAGDLDGGVTAVAAAIGATLSGGGKHPQMSTHNRLGATGNGTYLEVIAVDRGAPDPGRARWFGLDDVAPDAAARLANWLVSVPDLDRAIEAARGAGVDPGRAVPLSRGDLHWRISVPDSGTPPLAGAAPILIEWPGGQNPSAAMTPCGVTFDRLEVSTPDAAAVLAMTGALGGPPANVSIAEAADTRLRAWYTGPAGPQQLG